MSTPAIPPRSAATSRRWWARAALAAAAAAGIVLVAGAGSKTIPLLLLILAQLVLLLAGAWLFVSHRHIARALGAVVAGGSLVAALTIQAVNGLLWVSIVCAALLLASFAAGGAALRPVSTAADRHEVRSPPPTHPLLIMNPRSGGGKVKRFDLQAKAEQLGAEVALLDGPGIVDVAELARKAIDNGADLVGVAGGDGTQALVAGVAAARDVPLLVIPAGTRNHFALDLGLDREDPAKSLDALTDGVEIRVDLGDVGGRPFVNNVSFGAYAAIVSRPDYRDDKRRVTLDVLPDVLTQHDEPGLTVHAGDTIVSDPQAALVSNNQYAINDVAGLGRRVGLDGGVLGLIAIRVGNARQAVQLLRGRNASALTTATSDSVVIESVDGQLPAGIDGETVMLASPVECHVRPGVLRVRVPRDRAAQPAVNAPITLGALVRLAGPSRKTHAVNGS